MTPQDGIEINKTGEHFDEEAVSFLKIAQEGRQKLPCGAGSFPAFDTKLLCGIKQAISCRYQSDPESQIGLGGTFKDQLVPTPCRGGRAGACLPVLNLIHRSLAGDAYLVG